MTEPFMPRGDVAEYQLIVEAAKIAEPDVVFTYKDLDQILGRPFVVNRSPLYAARDRLERDHMKTLVCVREVGYRVAHAAEHAGLAKDHVRRSGRQLKRACSKANSADRNQLTMEQANRLDAMSVRISRIEAIVQSEARRREQNIRGVSG